MHLLLPALILAQPSGPYARLGPENVTHSTILDGEPYNTLGDPLAFAGDVNGDGRDDLLVAAANPGYVEVFHGLPGTAADGGIATTLTSQLSGTGTFGWSLDGAGDLDADGYDDVIVGAYGLRAWVFFGSAGTGTDGGVSDIGSQILEVGRASDLFGASVAGAGDVDGDGFSDVIVGAPGYDDDRGAAFVYAGGTGGIDTAAATTLDGPSAGGMFGGAVEGAGDVDNDGYDDVIVGSMGEDASAGAARVYPGGASGLSSTPTSTLRASGTFQFGWSLDRLGDANGDGYGDVVVGAPGGAYVFAGSASGVNEAAIVTFTEPEFYFGSSVAGAGDVDFDGYADILVGSNDFASNTGRAYLIAGGSRVGASVTTLDGENPNDYFGTSVGGAGDANGDGFADFAVCARGYDAYAGRVYVYNSYHDGDGDGASRVVDCDDADATVGEASTTAYADADGDGFGDATRSEVVCDLDGGEVLEGSDCDDADPAVYPGAPDRCDGRDDDCDGTAEELSTWYADADGDLYSSGTNTVFDCAAPAGYGSLTDPIDCDDSLASVYPGAEEIPEDGVDQDCDGEDRGEDVALPGDSGNPTENPDGCGCKSPSDPEGVGAVLCFAVLAWRRGARLATAFRGARAA